MSAFTDIEANCLCRDCGRLAQIALPPPETCPACASERLVAHPELSRLVIAHVDCDAFYASIEKRDQPELQAEPVIVGGGTRGVVMTCCYGARRFGVRSAMPMGQAMRLCPGAAVIRPDMEKYRHESHRIRQLMRETANKVESVSIDEAYLDLSDTAHDEAPARALARLALRIEKQIGVSISVGLAPNKMLAKIASDLDKPRGFHVIGESDALSVLAPMKVAALPGVGPVIAKKLEALGFTSIADLREAKADELVHRYGQWGRRLFRFAHGEDPRSVDAGRGLAVTIGAERTFSQDLRRYDEIAGELEKLCARVAQRLVRADLAAGALTLKLRRFDRKTSTHACRLHDPTKRADVILAALSPVLKRALNGVAFRLVGVTAHHLSPGICADPPDLFAEF